MTSARSTDLCHVSGQDNDSYMLGTRTRKAETEAEGVFFDWRFTASDGSPHPALCPCCGRKTDPSFIDPAFRVTRKRFDLSHTYDGYTIASRIFREACQTEHGAGLEFEPIRAESEFFLVSANRILSVDRDSPGLRFLYPCPVCREYAGVFGISHLRFLDADPDAIGWWRTDIQFAQAHQQQPLLVVGKPTAKWLRARKFKGVDVVPFRA